MPKHRWTSGKETGIVQDPENRKITIFAGATALELNGEENVLALVGPIREHHGGDRAEDGLLQRQAMFIGLLPSTMFTPIPQLTLRIPIQGVGGIIADIAKMTALLGP